MCFPITARTPRAESSTLINVASSLLERVEAASALSVAMLAETCDKKSVTRRGRHSARFLASNSRHNSGHIGTLTDVQGEINPKDNIYLTDVKDKNLNGGARGASACSRYARDRYVSSINTRGCCKGLRKACL